MMIVKMDGQEPAPPNKHRIAKCAGSEGLDLVPLLVPLCTVIWFFLVQQSAMWIINPTHSICCCYSAGCRAVRHSASEPKIGLKIRRKQFRGGSSPPPGTILQLRYVLQSIYRNERLGALFLRVVGVIV